MGDSRKENIIETKSFDFACKILDLRKILWQRKEYELCGQILRSGTSIGANVCEAIQAQSKADFFSKMNISLKEAFETQYWLRLIKYCNEKERFIDAEFIGELYDDCGEIIAILVSIVKHKDDDTNASMDSGELIKDNEAAESSGAAIDSGEWRIDN